MWISHKAHGDQRKATETALPDLPSRQPAGCSMLITMTDGVTVLFGAVGTVAAMLAVLVPVIRAQGAALRREIEGQGTSLRCEIEGQGESLRREIDTLRVDVGEVRRDLHVLSDRVARIEGALTGPWRPPANGTPAPASRPQSETEP